MYGRTPFSAPDSDADAVTNGRHLAPLGSLLSTLGSHWAPFWTLWVQTWPSTQDRKRVYDRTLLSAPDSDAQTSPNPPHTSPKRICSHHSLDGGFSFSRHTRHRTIPHNRLHTNNFTPTTSHQRLHTNDFAPTISHQRYHTNRQHTNR